MNVNPPPRPSPEAALELGLVGPVVWDHEVWALYRADTEWLVVIDPQGTIRAKDSVLLEFDCDGRMRNVHHVPLAVYEIESLFQE